MEFSLLEVQTHERHLVHLACSKGGPHVTAQSIHLPACLHLVHTIIPVDHIFASISSTMSPFNSAFAGAATEHEGIQRLHYQRNTQRSEILADIKYLTIRTRTS
jgi:hypothetical protein